MLCSITIYHFSNVIKYISRRLSGTLSRAIGCIFSLPEYSFSPSL